MRVDRRVPVMTIVRCPLSTKIVLRFLKMILIGDLLVPRSSNSMKRSFKKN